MEYKITIAYTSAKTEFTIFNKEDLNCFQTWLSLANNNNPFINKYGEDEEKTYIYKGNIQFVEIKKI